MSPTPQDVQAKLAQAQALLKTTSLSGQQMVKKYGSDVPKWPASSQWGQAFAQLAAASVEAGQLVAPPPPSPPPPPTPVPVGALLFSDDFNGPAGSAPDPNKWYVIDGYRINGLISSAANVFLDGNGHLVVRTARTTSGYSAGFLGTFNYTGWPPSGVKETFPVGFYVQAQMLMPPTPGAWAALWAMNTDRPTSEDIYELDIAEERMSAPTTAGTHQHTWLGGVDKAPADGSGTVSDMGKNWHVYGSAVSSDKVVNFVDGVEIASFYGVSGSLGLLLNNGIAPAGSWGADGGQPAASDAGPWDMLVAHSRVWELA